MLIQNYFDQLTSQILSNEAAFLKIHNELRDYGTKISYGFGCPLTKPFPVSLFPVFLSAAGVKKTYQDLRLVLSALIKIRDRFFSDEKLRANIGLPDDELAIITCDKQQNNVSSIRLDGFLQSDGSIKIVEVNSDFPDGMQCLSKLMACCEQRFYLKSFKNILPFPNFGELLLKSMLSSYEMNGGKGKPTFGFLHPNDRWWCGEQLNFMDDVKRAGFSARVLDPLSLEFDRGSLVSGGKKIDLVRKGTESFYFKKHFEQLKPFFEACKNKKVVVYNNFRDRLLGYKTLFAILTDEAWSHLFSEKEVCAIKRCIPWTRLIRQDGTISINEKPVNAFAFLEKRKDDFILKPSGDTDAAGVLIGSATSQNEWLAKLTEIVSTCKKGERWIVQERIEISKRRILRVEEDKFLPREVNYDLMFYLLGDKNDFLEGPIHSRSSENPIVNMSQGGAIHPVCVVSE